MSSDSPIESGAQHNGVDDVDIDDQRVLKSFYARHQVSTEFLRSSGNDKNESSNNHAGECARYRFVRLNPRYNGEETLRLLRAELSSQNDTRKTDTTSSYLNYPMQVPWLDARWGFYALPPDFRLAQSECFRTGRVYGQDVSSGAAVAALFSDFHQHHTTPTVIEEGITEHGEPWRVLDLCCAPGLKLCAMADWLGDKHYNPPTSTMTNVSDQQQQQQQQQQPSLQSSPLSPVIVGVDVSESRMAVCKRVVQKYHIDPETCGNVNDIGRHSRARIRIYCTDGTTFGLCKEEANDERKVARFASSLVFDSEASLAQQNDDRKSSSAGNGGGTAAGSKRKRLNKSARARLGKRLKQVAQLDCRLESGDVKNDRQTTKGKGERIAVKLFDRVLVDAECSTDGSLKHVQKRMQKELDSKVESGKSNNESTAQQSNLVRTLTSKQHLDELVDLQKRLAASGFRLLKPGGFMVYSTCSLCVQQNEEVVEWLLQEHDQEARLVPVEFGPSSSSSSLSQIRNCGLVKEGKLGMTFLPNTNSDELCGGGFFLAKIEKMAHTGRRVGDDDSGTNELTRQSE